MQRRLGKLAVTLPLSYLGFQLLLVVAFTAATFNGSQTIERGDLWV